MRNLKFKIKNRKAGMARSIFSQGHPEYSRGMTYVELIVVLTIFSVLASVSIYNYGAFQAKVDIKNLASDIALKIVEAQKSSVSGILPAQAPTISGWKPSYGIYFNLNTDAKGFIYFTDLNNSHFFDGSNCTSECLNYVAITKGNYISKLETFVGTTATLINNPIAITFKRPASGAVFSYSDGVPVTGFDYLSITITSPKAVTAIIKVYPSGRIQIN